MGRSTRLIHGRCSGRKVYRLLGTKDLGVGDNYKRAKLPPVNQGLLGGQHAWRQYGGGHTDGPNLKYFIEWAERMMDHDGG